MKLRKKRMLTFGGQLRKAAAQLARIPVNDDAELDKRIEEEARNEEETLKRICDDLNVELAEVNNFIFRRMFHFL